MMPFGGNSSSLFLLAGIAVLTWIMMRKTYTRKSLPRPGWVSEEEVDSSRESMQKTLGDMPSNAERLKAEVHDFSRDQKTELDTKMRALQQLTLLAQQQAERLENAVDKAEQLGLSPCRDTLEEIKQVTADPVAVDQLLGVSPLPLGNLPEFTSHQPQLPAADDALLCRIYGLADDGLEAVTIAERVRVPVGDIEMMLSLRGGSI